MYSATMQNTLLKQITGQMSLIYDEDPWYGTSIKEVLESVSPKRVFDSPGNGMHSIAELVAHMVTWREFAERRLRGETGYLPDQELSFDWKRFASREEDAWKVMLARLETNQRNLLTLLDQHEDALLEREVTDKPYTFYYLLTGLLQHDLYHLGQIAYIQKLLCKKDKNLSEAGILRYSFRVFPFENLARQK